MKKQRRAYGGGYIRERALKSGELRFDVIVRTKERGQHTLKTCRSSGEADAYLAAWHEERASNGHYVPYDSGVITLRRLGHLYLDRLPPKRMVTDKSRWAARIETAEFIDWPVSQIDEQAVSRWIDTMARTPIATGKAAGQLPSRSTLQNALNLLRDALKWGRIKGHVATNAAKTITISDSTVAAPRSSVLGLVYDYLREDEVKKLLSAELPPTQKTAFVLLAFTGARPKDLYLLTWDRVNVRGGGAIRYRSHKRDRDYEVHLLPPALEVLRAWWIRHGQPTSGLVFPGPATDEWPSGAPHAKGYDWGWPDTEPQPGRRYDGYRARAGIKRRVPLYSLRHTCACMLLLGAETFTGGERWSFAEIASHLGHADLSTVQRYAIALGIASHEAVKRSREAIKERKREAANRSPKGDSNP